MAIHLTKFQPFYHFKVCLNVPTTLDITITVAEGFLRGDKTYQRIVKTLDKQLNRTNLKAFDDLDVYEHMDAVKKRMEEMVFIEEASTEVVERAREHLQRVERKKSKKLSSFEMPPNHPPRQQESAKQKVTRGHSETAYLRQRFKLCTMIKS
jgi:hypothetical protein